MLDTTSTAICLHMPRPHAELALITAGYTRQPVAPVALVNHVAGMECPWCREAGLYESRPYWRGAHCVVVARCTRCRYTEEV